MFGRDVSESLHLEHARREQDRGQLVVGHADLAVVHEAKQSFHVTVLDVSQDHNRVLARVGLFLLLFTFRLVRGSTQLFSVSFIIEIFIYYLE